MEIIVVYLHSVALGGMPAPDVADNSLSEAESQGMAAMNNLSRTDRIVIRALIEKHSDMEGVGRSGNGLTAVEMTRKL